MNEWQQLANAIVLQAVKDYKAAQRALIKKPDSKKDKATIRECDRFFRSNWYEMLTDIKPDCLLRNVEGKVDTV